MKKLKLTDKIAFGKYKNYTVNSMISKERPKGFKWIKWILSRRKSLKITFSREVFELIYSTIKINYKDNFYRILEKCSNSTQEEVKNIALFLIDLSNGYRNSNMTNIDWNSKKGMISFTDPIQVGKKSEIKLGRFVKHLFVKNYVNYYTPREIEIFVNFFKGVSDIESKEKFIRSNKIKRAYDMKLFSKTSSLEGSCMQGFDKNEAFELYEKNGVEILTLEEEGKLKGRALLWKVYFPYLEKTKLFMDRIYSISSVVESKFFKWAEDNDCVIKTFQSFSEPTSFKYNGEKFIDNPRFPISFLPKFFPFVDTFKMLEDKHLVAKCEGNDDEHVFFVSDTGNFWINDNSYSSEESFYDGYDDKYDDIYQYFEKV